MKIFQIILFSSTLSFACCGFYASSDVDGQLIVVSEERILENNLIDEAIKIIEGVGPPMQGIGTLLLYADSDSPNVKANFWLGKFGVQSQQLEKAKARFLKVLEIIALFLTHSIIGKDNIGILTLFLSLFELSLAEIINTIFI